MAITYENNKAIFESVIYEDELIAFRDFLQTHAGEELEFDYTQCDDIHLAILQLIMAYKKNYDCSYIFGETQKIFETVLRGFDTSEDYCN